jgi:hypothetical protein
LRRLDGALELAGEELLRGDVAQIAGLVERIDHEAFLPLTTNELTGPTPARIIQFCQLVDDLVAALLKEFGFSKQGLKATGGAGWYGHYVRIHGFGCQVLTSAPFWQKHGTTPLWLRVGTAGEPGWQFSPAAHEALVRGIGRDSVVLSRERGSDGTLVPLRLRERVDRNQVLDHLVEQVQVAANCLAALQSSSAMPGVS